MTEGRILGQKPDIRYLVERESSAPIGGEPVVRAANRITPEMIESLNKKVAGLLGKIDKLQSEIKRTTREYVPVHEKAYEVRHALRSLFPGRPEDKIFFDEYVAALEYKFKRTDVNSLQLISVLSGNSEVDARLIEEAEWAAGDDISAADVVSMFSQFLLLRVANTILQPHSAKDAADMAAPKMPPGTERAPMAGKIVLGLAALLYQIADNAESARSLLKDTLKGTDLEGMDTDEVMAQAQAQEKDPAVAQYDRTRGPYYWDCIDRSVNDYVANTNEPGYEGWASYSATQAYKSEFHQTSGEMGAYGRTAGEAAESSWQMSKDMYRLILYRADSANEQLNKIAAVLSSRITSDVLCCLVLFIGAIPTDHLKVVRAALSIAANGLTVNFNSAMAGWASKVNSFMAEQLLEPVLHALDKHYSRFVKYQLDLLDKARWKDPDTYDAVMKCTPVDMLLEFSFYGLDQLYKILQRLVMKAWRRVEVKQVKGNFSWKLLADVKSAKVILNILDKVVEAIERGNLCAREGGHTPSAEEVEQLTQQLADGFAPSISVPVGDETSNPFEVFKVKPFNSSLGFPVMAEEAPSEGVAKVPVKFRIADCMRQNNPQQLLKALGLSVQLSRELRHARNVDKARPNS